MEGRGRPGVELSFMFVCCGLTVTYAMAASMGWANLGTLSTVPAGRWGGQIWVLTWGTRSTHSGTRILTGVLGVRSKRAGEVVRYVAGVSWNDAIDVASCQRHFACAYLQTSKAIQGPLPNDVWPFHAKPCTKPLKLLALIWPHKRLLSSGSSKLHARIQIGGRGLRTRWHSRCLRSHMRLGM
jgi:hypothetical protein